VCGWTHTHNAQNSFLSKERKIELLFSKDEVCWHFRNAPRRRASDSQETIIFSTYHSSHACAEISDTCAHGAHRRRSHCSASSRHVPPRIDAHSAAIQHSVLHDVDHERRELGRRAQPLREWNTTEHPLLRVVRSMGAFGMPHVRTSISGSTPVATMGVSKPPGAIVTTRIPTA
jgi:hypothetical protein